MIIITHILRNIKEKVWISFGIILSVAVCVAVLLLNLQISENVEKTSSEFSKRTTGWADLTVTIKENLQQEFFSLEDLDLNNDHIKGRIPGVKTYGKTMLKDNQVTKVHLFSVDISEATEFGLLNLIEGKSGDGIIISSNAAKKYNLHTGDLISIEVDGNILQDYIIGISANEGIFFEELGGITVVTGGQSLDRVLELQQKKNFLYLNIEDGYIDEAIEYLVNYNQDFLISSGHHADTAYLQIALVLSLGIVVIMGVYIVYSISNLLFTDRIKTMGTFLSVGADRKKIYQLLLLENLVYGFAGFGLGFLLGLISLKVVGELFNEYRSYGISSVISLNPLYIIISILFALFLSLLMTSFYIMKIKRLSIKDIMLDTAESGINISYKNLLYGAGGILVALGLNFINKNYNLLFAVFSVLLLIIGFIWLIPILVNIGANGIAYINQVIFGPVAKLGSINITNNKISNNIIKVITIIISLVLGVFSILLSIQGNSKNLSSGQNYDVIITNLEKDMSKFNSIQQILGVKNSLFSYEKITRFSYQKKGMTFALKVIDPEEKIKEFEPGILYESGILEKLSSGKGILIDEFRARIYGISLGDTLTIDDETVNNNKIKYQVIGLIDSSGFTADRSVALISQENFQIDIGHYPSKILIESDMDSGVLVDELKNQLIDTNAQVSTQNEYLMGSYIVVGKALNVMVIILAFGIIMGLTGIANYQLSGFIQRKRELAGLYSVGLDLNLLKKMLIFEIITEFFLAVFYGLILGMLFLLVLPNLMGAVGLAIDFVIPAGFLLILSLVIGLILILTALSAVKKITTINIIGELKYE